MVRASFVFRVGEPLKLSILQNLLVRPHVKEFYRGLESLCLHAWKLRSNLSARQAFLRRLQMLSQLASIRESGLDSCIGVMKGMVLLARPLHNG